MSTTKQTATDKLNNAVAMEKEQSELQKIRACVTAFYANTAVQVFRKYVEISESDFDAFMKQTENGTKVYTQPTEDTLKANAEKFQISRKFGSVQWYVKRQEVLDAFNLISSYNSYLRYMDSKENQEAREEKQLEKTAQLLGVSVETLKALKKK